MRRSKGGWSDKQGKTTGNEKEEERGVENCNLTGVLSRELVREKDMCTRTTRKVRIPRFKVDNRVSRVKM